jgi:dihydrofolate synthase/folylpolyglutamate synthase
MTYTETLDYLYQQLPMFSRIGSSAFKKDLTNTHALCAVLDNPQDKFPTIHVGGTNGKGSTAHMLAAILQAMGLRVGLYVSPHYRDFRERIKINGVYISKGFIQKFVSRNRSHFERIQPSFFEMTVAMAFDYFHKEQVDIAVIEVGLGGRLDSTNVIKPLVSVITNISYDHTDMLGDTLAQIAFEKAGIIKAHTPVVIGEEHPETASVFLEKAHSEQAPLVFASQNIVLEKIATDTEGVVLNSFYKTEKLYAPLFVGLTGDYQLKNIATVLETVGILQKLPSFIQLLETKKLNLSKTNTGVLGVDTVRRNPLSGEGGQIWENSIRKGLGQVKTLTNFIGRWQTIGEKPTILCDSAHNEGGLRLAMKQLAALNFNQLHMVMGFVKDKDLSTILDLLPKEATYYFCKANIPRGLASDILKEQAAEKGLSGKAYPSVRRAFAAAKRQAAENDLVYVGGSIFVLAEVL